MVFCALRTANVYVDKTASSCRSVEYENSSTSSYTVTVGCSNDNSGCKSNPFKIDNQTSSGTLEVEDNVGNKQTC